MGDFDVEDFRRKLATAGEKAKLKVAEAVSQFAQHVIGDAQQLTPVATGALQASGVAEPAEVLSDDVSVKLGFNTPYAAPVHENLEANHEVGEAKFLETALRVNQPKFGEFVASKTKEVL